MANRPTRRYRLARRLASSLLLCAMTRGALADTPNVPVDPVNAIDVIADAGGMGAGGGGETLYLEIVVNGNETHKLAAFSRFDGALHVGNDTLRQLGFRLPEGATGTVDLGALPGVSYRYD